MEDEIRKEKFNYLKFREILFIIGFYLDVALLIFLWIMNFKTAFVIFLVLIILDSCIGASKIDKLRKELGVD